MTLNWYLDADGTTHRLHTRDGWTDTVLGDVTLPIDSAVPLGRIDGIGLSTALREAAVTLETAIRADGNDPDADGTSVEPARLYLCAGRRGDDETFLVSGTHDDLAVLRAVPWEPTTRSVVFDALAEVRAHELPQTTGLTQLSVGADENWTATLELTGVLGSRRIALHRDPVEVPPLQHLQGDPHVSATVGTRDLYAALDRIPAGEDVTFAFVPDRVLVRGTAGMVGTLESPTTGTPLQGTFAADRLGAGLSGLDGDTRTVSLALFRERDNPSLRLAACEANALFSVLPRGWRYL